MQSLTKRLSLIFVCFFFVLCFASCKGKVTIEIELSENETIQGEFSKENKKGTPILDILENVTVEKEGHTFVGFMLNDKMLEKTDKLGKNNIIVKPIFKVNTYKITYKIEGLEDHVEEYEYGKAITPYTVPTKEGFSNGRWNEELPKVMPAKDLEFNAIYAPNTYKIAFKVNDAIVKLEYHLFNDAIDYAGFVPSLPKGYTFDKWDAEIPEAMPAKDLEFNAVIITNSYTISYYVDGALAHSDTFKYGDEITVYTPDAKEGYSFKGYDKEIPTKMPYEDISVNAIFSGNLFNVNFVVDEKIVKTLEVACGDALNITYIPDAKEGYTFTGFKETAPATMPAKDLTFTAVYSINKYTITYKVEGYSDEVKEYEFNQEIDAYVAPILCGWTFEKWSEQIPTNMPARNIEVSAVYKINQYQLTYKVEGMEDVVVVYDYDAEIKAVSDPTLDDATFLGWVPEIPTNMPANDLVVTANFKKNYFEITYDYKEGKWPLTYYTNINDLLDELFTDFHTWLGSTKPLATFIKDASGSYKNGKWQDDKAKLYAAELKEVRENSEYFINDAFYNEKWLGVFDALDKAVTEINASQSFWGSTYVGCIRLYELGDYATRYTDAQKSNILSKLGVEVTPKTRYHLGDEFDLLPLSLNDGREFVGWFEGDTKITKVTADMQRNLTLVAKWTDPIFPETITITNPLTTLDRGENYTLNITLTPTNITHSQLVFESSVETVATIKDGVITTIGYGETKITIYSKYKTNVKVEFTLKVFPDISDDKPVIYIPHDEKTNVVIKGNEPYDLLKNVKAYDKTDGDLTSKIKVDDSTLDPYTAGKYTITYSVTDNDANETKLSREVVVVVPQQVIFIGHAGCYSGIMNTEEAFINAAVQKGYKAIECDVKQTKDGVFVTCHDNDFAGIDLASTNYADIKDVVRTQTRGGITYSSKICTFKRYLEICKQYDVYPVVELKSSAGITNSDQSRMDELMQEIKDVGMLDKVIFLTSQYKCLEWVRNNGYKNIPCQYLVNSCESQSIFDRCVQWNFDVSFNIAYANSEEWIARYQEAGLKVSSYTFNQYQDAATLQAWIDKGVNFVTCDVLTENDVTLPEINTGDDLPEFTVKFVDYNGTILKETTVKQGRKAIAPFEPKRDGYKFTGWDSDFTNVTTNLVVTAEYEKEVYTITYDPNFVVYTEKSWENKAAFLNDFYTDLFNWVKDSAGVVSGITKDGASYKVTTSASTNNVATFTNVSSLMALDKYVVEKTIGTYIYKPVTNNSANLEMEENSNYFLNTEPYRTKYKALNAYFLKVMETRYTAYNRGYGKNSAGAVQIFFRFHQWQQGTSIAEFDTLPKMYEATPIQSTDVTLPTSPLTYTITDSFTLQSASCEGYTFVGWYKDQKCTILVTTIEEGTFGNIKLYAKWTKNA